MFITLEGPDGSGKSSQVAPLVDFLRQSGQAVIATREPGGTSIGDQIRSVLLNIENTDMQPRTEILLFQAARAQHVDQVIRPALGQGKVVICDRFADSTLAYQGFGEGGDLLTLRTLVDFATAGLKPDLTLLLDIDAQTGIQRRKNCGGEWNRLDANKLAYHERVRQGYLQLAREEPARWVIIDACQSPERVQSALRAAILPHLGH
jgi:dTMP kinase